MLRKREDQNTYVKENMRGGDGAILFADLLTPEEMYAKGRLFSKLVVKPGCSVGFHTHEGEMEAYFVIKGVGEFDDNGEKRTLRAGDLLYTPDGSGHAVRNTGGLGDLAGADMSGIEDLEILALILYK